MAIWSGFFNSVAGDRSYSAAAFAEYFAAFIANGVFLDTSTSLQVTENSTMDVTVAAGKAWINGYIMVNFDDYDLTIDAADGVYNRIDRVVVRFDTAGRAIGLAVSKGTPGSSPVAPALVRDANYYELGLADVAVGAGVTSIEAADITDLRANSVYCGAVSSVIERPDPTSLFIFFSNTVVAVGDWAADTTHADYGFRAAIALTGVVATMLPYVMFSEEQVSTGIYGATADPYAGGIYIYAKVIPSGSITIPTIHCIRTVV